MQSLQSADRVSNISFTDLQVSRKYSLNPNCQNMNMRTNVNAPTTIPDLTSSAIHFQTPDEGNSQKGDGPTLPYPFMSGFVDRKMGNRFTKRVNFD